MIWPIFLSGKAKQDKGSCFLNVILELVEKYTHQGGGYFLVAKDKV